jgi:hypothetical protein
MGADKMTLKYAYTSHSLSGSPTDMRGRRDSKWISKEAWSGAEIGLKMH